MAYAKLDAEEIARLGEERYERDIRPVVEPQHIGEFLVIDVDTGDYEVDPDEVAALQRAKAKRPAGRRFLKRVGYTAAHRIGGALKVTRP